MPRVLQRVRTGCDRCKKRKKKCDEVKPACGFCSRWGFECIRSGGNKDKHQGSTANAPIGEPLELSRPITGHGCTEFRDQTQLSLLRSFDDVYQRFICPLAGDEYKDLSSFVTVALYHAWSRDALNALTGYMLFTRTANKRLEESALVSYQLAVLGLRSRANHPVRGDDSVSILLAATCLGLVEGLGTGNAALTIVHFTLAVQLAQDCLARQSWDASLLSLKRMILEDILCNLARTSILHPLPDFIQNTIDWSEYDRTFNNGNPRAPAYCLSPHLGGNHEFYRLMIDITCFSRRTLGQEMRICQVKSWLDQIDYLEKRLCDYYKDAPTHIAKTYRAKYQLHAAALRIFCFKIQNHNLSPSAPEVREQLEKAKVCCWDVSKKDHNPALMWPFVVFLCACSDPATLGFFVQHIEQNKLNLDRGPLQMLRAVKNILCSIFRSGAGLNEDAIEKNFCLLLNKKGILEDSGDLLEPSEVSAQ